jgi:TPR repeat protein
MNRDAVQTLMARPRLLFGVILFAVIVIAEALSGWGRHQLAHALGTNGYKSGARFIYATLASDNDPLALNNYAALLDISMADIPGKTERRRVFLKVRNMYKRAAAKGLAAAQFNAGLQTYRATRPDSPDFPAAREWLRQAADKGDLLAGLAYARDLSRFTSNPEYPERMRRLQALADRGLAEAQELYGDALRATDEAGAQRYLRLAAQQGHSLAIEGLGFSLLRTSVSEGVLWLQKAAEAGSIPAQGALGEIYRDGDLGQPDYDKAVYWLTMAADKTSVRERIGEVLYFPDPSGFRCCLTVGGWMDNINNDIAAAYELAELYVDGRGVPQDLERARELYTKAAEIDWKDSKERLQEVERQLAADRAQ